MTIWLSTTSPNPPFSLIPLPSPTSVYVNQPVSCRMTANSFSNSGLLPCVFNCIDLVPASFLLVRCFPIVLPFLLTPSYLTLFISLHCPIHFNKLSNSLSSTPSPFFAPSGVSPVSLPTVHPTRRLFRDCQSGSGSGPFRSSLSCGRMLCYEGDRSIQWWLW